MTYFEVLVRAIVEMLSDCSGPRSLMEQILTSAFNLPVSAVAVVLESLKDRGIISEDSEGTLFLVPGMGEQVAQLTPDIAVDEFGATKGCDCDYCSELRGNRKPSLSELDGDDDNWDI